MVNYTDRIDNFQIRDVTYIPGFEPKQSAREFDIVKWETCSPLEVTDGSTGEKKIITESCYSVARLKWNEHECYFEFESVGLRWLEEQPSAAVCQVIMAFAEFKKKEYEALLWGL